VVIGVAPGGGQDDPQDHTSLPAFNKPPLGKDWQGEVAQLAAELAASTQSLEAVPDDLPEGLRAKERAFRTLQASKSYQRSKLAADAWCAAFFQPKAKGDDHITHDTVRRLAEEPGTVPADMRLEIERLAAALTLFHWHVEFPQVFTVPEGGSPGGSGWSGGFDVVLSNPPWERVKLQEREFFAANGRLDIASARNKSLRGRLIEQLTEEDVTLHRKYLEAQRRAEAESHFLRHSGRYPLCGRGDVNTYAVFAEGMRSLVSSRGRQGCVIPTGIATDDTTKHFFADLVNRRTLVSLYDFQSGPGLFAEIGHARFKFCLLTIGGSDVQAELAEFAFFLRDISHLHDRERRFALTRDDIALLNPNTRTCPIFRSRRDAEITKAIYRRVPVLIKEGGDEAGNSWQIEFMAMFHMTNDSRLFRTREQLEGAGFARAGNRLVRGSEVWLPLYEAKMVHHFNHRFGDYSMRHEGSEDTELPEVPVASLQDLDYTPLPRYWVPRQEVEVRLQGRWPSGWLLGWRDITNATNERTVVAAVIPRVAVGNKFPLVLSRAAPMAAACLTAALVSYGLDYVARQKLGGTTLNYFILKQLPILPPNTFDAPCTWDSGGTVGDWIRPRVLELSYTARDLASFAQDLDYMGSPFVWDPGRRFLLRCELDAAFFQLYGVSREDLDYILDTFPIVRAHDEDRYGEYCTKRVILEIYDALAEAAAAGRAYRSRLEPPPADPRAAHSARRLAPVLELRRIGSPADDDKYQKVVPLLTLKAAAGAFGDPQAVEADAWVEVPGQKLTPGMFIARVVGHSMEPGIPDGAWCLFKLPVTGSRQGKVVLVQHRDISDPESGGTYTVKRYRSAKRATEEGAWGHAEVILEPLNRDFEPIVLRGLEEDEVRVIAQVMKVFPPEALYED
jgi:SOS-response transcriptional repressor LexA